MREIDVTSDMTYRGKKIFFKKVLNDKGTKKKKIVKGARSQEKNFDDVFVCGGRLVD